MGARFRSWWQHIKQHPYVTSMVVMFILFILSAYWFSWDWTGFSSSTSQIFIASKAHGNYTANLSQPSKSLWDWLQLLGVLAIPVVVGLGAAWYTAQQGKVSDRENKDNQRERALQAYIDKISELLLHEHLGELQPEYEKVRMIARVRTLTVLRGLDATRKTSVLKFLYESRLLQKGNPVIALNSANFVGADLPGVNLFGVSLVKADLSQAHLHQADLSRADLRLSRLEGTDLNTANLVEANLSRADLQRANLSYAGIVESNSIGGAVISQSIFLDASDATFDEASFWKKNGVNLSFANLTGANLSYAYLRGANLSGADLRGADLHGADLNWADLGGAYLCGADLRGAKLGRTNLLKADQFVGWLDIIDDDQPELLKEHQMAAYQNPAYLMDADLDEADLSGADLTGAQVTPEQLQKAKSLQGATMPDGSLHAK